MYCSFLNQEQQVLTSLSGSGTYTLFTIRLQNKDKVNNEEAQTTVG